MLIIWGLRVIYRTLGRGVFFCRRCGGDREYRQRAGRRYITVFFIPLVPLTRTGAHVQCLTCKTRYVTEVLKLPTTVQMQVALVAGMRALVAVMLRAGEPVSPLARRRAVDAVAGAGDRGYDEAALEEDPTGRPADRRRTRRRRAPGRRPGDDSGPGDRRDRAHPAECRFVSAPPVPAMLLGDMSHVLLLLSGRGGGR
jgi:hypothetical protein